MNGIWKGLPVDSAGEESTCHARHMGSIRGSGRSLEKETATHSSILVWRIPRTEEPGRLQSKMFQRLRHNQACMHTDTAYEKEASKMGKTTFYRACFPSASPSGWGSGYLGNLITARSVEWLLSEMETSRQEPALAFRSFQVKGQEELCREVSRKRASLVAQRLKCLPAKWETWVQSLGQEDPLEKEMATHSSILAWRIPWRAEPGRLQSMRLQRVGHD